MESAIKVIEYCSVCMLKPDTIWFGRHRLGTMYATFSCSSAFKSCIHGDTTPHSETMHPQRGPYRKAERDRTGLTRAARSAVRSSVIGVPGAARLQGDPRSSPGRAVLEVLGEVHRRFSCSC